jgi:hypothetical protein
MHSSGRHNTGLPLRFIACDRVRSDGKACGQTASIEADDDVVDGTGQTVALAYMIICPNCGRRRQDIEIDA